MSTESTTPDTHLGGQESSQWADAREAAERYQSPDWRLLWSDEFDKDGAPDPARWTYEEGMVRNKEAQFYTHDRRENARIENGNLVISARKEPWQDAVYTSASLTTHGRFSFCYGKVEIRAKVPGGRGTWPALWTLGDSISTVRWPRCGEIDLMEHVGFNPDHFHFTVHTEAFNHVRGTQRGTKIKADNATADFHRFGLIWTPERLEWFLDDTKVFEFANTGGGIEEWPFDTPQYLILCLAIGGTWGGSQGIDDSIFPADLLVDYVRVWQNHPI